MKPVQNTERQTEQSMPETANEPMRLEPPEHQSPTEALDLQRKIQDTLAGQRPIEATYPYFSPDYKLPFVHIGTERQLFVDNYMLDHLDGVERVFPTPD